VKGTVINFSVCPSVAIRDNIVSPQFFHLFLENAKLQTFRENNLGAE